MMGFFEGGIRFLVLDLQYFAGFIFTRVQKKSCNNSTAYWDIFDNSYILRSIVLPMPLISDIRHVRR